MCPATPKLQRAFGRHKSQAVLVGNPTVCGGFMFGCACHSFSDSVCISNAGFPDVAVSEYYETESHKSLCTSQNTIFLSIFGSLCYTSLSIVYKDAKQFGKTYECSTVKIQVSCRNYRRETNKQNKGMQRKGLLLSLSFARNCAPSALLSCTPPWPRRSSQ